MTKEKEIRQVIDLYLEAGKYYDDVIKKERNMYGYSDLAIKLLDGTVDVKEMSIQYVLNKIQVFNTDDTYKEIRPKMISLDKACEWLKNDMIKNNAFSGRLERTKIIDGIINNFRKAISME